jgi:hypothetical protein
VRAVLARQLSAERTLHKHFADSALLDLLIAERHPLASEDAALVRMAEALPFRCRIVHDLSLEDPLLQFVGADRIRKLLERLGATEEEPHRSSQ